MSKQTVSGSIESLITFYKQERNIYGRCPNCDEPFRLSEVKLTYGKEPPRDLISRLKKERNSLQERLDSLEADIESIQDEHETLVEAIQDDSISKLDTLEAKWQDRVGLEVEKQTKKREKQIRQNAISRSRAGQLGKTLEKVVPMFPGFGHHPYDVRPVFDPIDFVVFDGYYQGNVTDICFVEFKTGQSKTTSIQNSIRSAIEKKRVHFQEKRLSSEAIKMLTEGASLGSRKRVGRLME